MSFNRRIFTVDTHTEGEPTRIVIGGIEENSDVDLLAKRDFFAKNFDHLRRSLLHEPRGHKGMYGAILVRPTRKEADAAAVFMRSDSFNDDMCIHGTIGIVTALVEMGFVEHKPEITLETPAGLVKARVSIDSGRVRSVSVSNVPSFYFGNFSVPLDGYGEVKVEIAYGGNFYAIVDAKSVGLKVEGKYLQELSRFGASLITAVNKFVDVSHPTLPIYGVNHALISDDPKDPKASLRNLVVGDAGWFDRSPCGTGTCARMVALHKNGELDLDSEFVHESFVGTLFRGKLVEKTRL